MPDRMLAIAQAVELTGLSRSTIYALVKRGELPENHPIGPGARKAVDGPATRLPVTNVVGALAVYRP
jgi:excisionase family DNA binding protein